MSYIISIFFFGGVNGQMLYVFAIEMNVLVFWETDFSLSIYQL